VGRVWNGGGNPGSKQNYRGFERGEATGREREETGAHRQAKK